MKILLFILFLPAIVLAHPISQGALDVELSSSKLQVHARVPVEEVLLANAFATGNAQSLTDAYQEHGQYFLAHVQIKADSAVLKGAVTSWAEDHKFIIYQLEYPLLALPNQLSFRQNLLNEFLFAPGNPWEASFVVRVSGQGRVWHEGLLLASKQILTVDNMTIEEDRIKMFGEYFRHGVTHILTGYDHLLFIIALVLATVTLWDLIKVVSAFTLAHTMTLTLSLLGAVHLPSAVVEPMIAASIVFVAISNIVSPHSSRGVVRLGTAFFFGLFHGLGFAGGLLDAMNSMPGITIGVAIVAFSLGVEFGHQMVVMPVFAGLQLFRQIKSDECGQNRWSVSIVRIGSLVISVAGMFYLITALK